MTEPTKMGQSVATDGESEFPFYDDTGEDWDCTHCGGDGVCMDGTDPLGNCPDEPHRCHACGGSGRRRDQTIF